MMRNILGALCMLLSAATADAATVGMLRELPWTQTPVYAAIAAEEQRFVESFPHIFIEEEGIGADPLQIESLYKLVRDRDLAVCMESDWFLQGFCRFFVSVNLMGVDSPDFDQFIAAGGVLGELGRVGLSLQHAKKGDIIQAAQVAGGITSSVVGVYFGPYLAFIDAVSPSGSGGVRTPFEYARLYRDAEKNPAALSSAAIAGDSQGYLLFVAARHRFFDADWSEAAELFLRASRNESLRPLSLENAAYCFFNAADNRRLDDLLPQLADDTRELIETMQWIERKKNGIPGRLFDDRLFRGYVLRYVRDALQRSGNLSFLARIGRDDLDEDTQFYVSFARFVYGGRKLPARQWQNEVYRRFWSRVGQFEAGINVPEYAASFAAMIERFGFQSYYPFDLMYGTMLYRAGDGKAAIAVFEDLLKYPKKMKGNELDELSRMLAELYRRKGSFYTALRILDEAAGRSPEKAEEIGMEIVRILLQKEDWEELLWRAERLRESAAEEHNKKELLFLIETCYEKLGRTRGR